MITETQRQDAVVAKFIRETESHIIGYTVTNRITGAVTHYKTGPAASRACDRMDNAYGAVICTRRAIWGD